MALLEDLKTRFQDIPTATIDKYFSRYENIYRCYFNAEYGLNDCDDEIILNLFAHLIITSDNTQQGQDTKVISSDSVDGVSTSYAIAPMNSMNDTYWLSTIYGQTFKMLTQKNMGGFFV